MNIYEFYRIFCGKKKDAEASRRNGARASTRGYFTGCVVAYHYHSSTASFFFPVAFSLPVAASPNTYPHGGSRGAACFIFFFSLLRSFSLSLSLSLSLCVSLALSLCLRLSRRWRSYTGWVSTMCLISSRRW